tara:strand:- start:877 stop:1089 length:213 start_codon:yes stop_codon:yes gene_type:complete
MCFGGGGSPKVKTAQEYYAETKPTFGKLPSLSMTPDEDTPERTSKKLKDVGTPTMRQGTQARGSLLNQGY